MTKPYPEDKNVGAVDGKSLNDWATGGKRQSDDPRPPAAADDDKRIIKLLNDLDAEPDRDRQVALVRAFISSK